MKTFNMSMLDNFGSPETFTEHEPPWWLISKEFKWFFDSKVLTLKVGDFIDTDFRRITRIQ